MIVVVDADARSICFAGSTHPCAIGRNGVIDAGAKREGDGCTPVGDWPVRGVILRPGRGYAPPAGLPWRWSREDEGWCDDPTKADYNRPVRLPYAGSAEQLFRSDNAYDAVVVLGFNDRPPEANRGSAIFLHLRTIDDTAGCIGVEPDTMRRLLEYANSDMVVRVVGSGTLV